MFCLKSFLNIILKILLDTKIKSFIYWNKNDNFLVIKKLNKFYPKVLHIFFKKNFFSSFVRTLNDCGFKKIFSRKWIFWNKNFKFIEFWKFFKIFKTKKNRSKVIKIFKKFWKKFIYKQKKKKFCILNYKLQTLFLKNIFQINYKQNRIILQNQKFRLKQNNLEFEIKNLLNELNILKSFFFDYLSKNLFLNEDKIDLKKFYFNLNFEKIPEIIPIFKPIILEKQKFFLF
jgi:hypothetical protein